MPWEQRTTGILYMQWVYILYAAAAVIAAIDFSDIGVVSLFANRDAERKLRQIERQQNEMRVMGLDLGEKRIGVALSDPLGVAAQGITVIRRVNLKSDLYRIKELIEKYGVEEVVVGLPLNMNGTPGASAEAASRFRSYLREKVNLPVHLWDERLTTSAAEKALLEGDVSRARRKKVIDKIAAVLILESYLATRENN